MEKKNVVIDKSLVIPIYCNEANIASLLNALTDINAKVGQGFEVVFVVDGSPDDSYQLLNEACSSLDYPIQIICHSRNFGAFTAIRTGMEYAKGKYIAVMAADLQEPPSLILDFFKLLENDSADVIFGQRISRKDPFCKSLLSNIYWKFYRSTVQPDIPKGGVDIFACNSAVREKILEIHEPNSSLIAQLFWVGYRRSFIPYERQKREEGKSAWGFRKRIRYMLDSIFSYSDFPIMAILWIGALSLLVTFGVSVFTILGKLSGWINVPGYSTTTLMLMFLGSAILTTQGIIGCYLWRTFENTKRRPLSIVSQYQGIIPQQSNEKDSDNEK